MHIDVNQNARADLDALWATEPAAAATVEVTLQEMQGDPRIVDKLTQHGENVVGGARLNVKRWVEAKRPANVWRFRILDTPATSYRVVYGYHWQTRQLCVLAVVHKDHFDYELDSILGRRIMADWASL